MLRLPLRIPGAALFAAAALLAAFAACSNPMPTPSPTPTPTAEPAPLPPAEGTLRVGVTGAAPHKDMHAMLSEWAALFGPGPSHGRLMRFALVADGPPTLEVECDLCESWRFVDDLTAEFQLSPEARWQPAEGFESRPVTPQDVAFSVNRLRMQGLPHEALLDSIESAEPVSEDVVRFNLRYPDPDLPIKLASPYVVILAPDSLDGVNVRRNGAPGAGPWLYERGGTGQVTLTTWDGHDTGTKVERIVFHPASNAALVTRLFRQGRVDLAQVPESDWPSLEEEGFSSEVVLRSGRGVLFGLNSERPPFDNREARQAAFMTLSPHDALRQTFGIGSVATGLPLADSTWAIPQHEVDAAFGDPAQARAMLDVVGVQRSITLTVANFGETYVEHGRLLAEQLQETGFEVAVEVLSRAVYLRQVWEERDFDAFVGPVPPTDTPNAFLLGLVHSDGAFNVTGGTSALDALIEQQAAELEGVARAELAQEIQQEMLGEALFFMAAGAAERWAFSDRVTGFVPRMPMGAGDLWALVGVTENDAADAVAAEQKPLRPLRADVVDPHLMRRSPLRASGREADHGVVGHDDQVAQQCNIGATGQAIAVHLGDDRLVHVEQRHLLALLLAHLPDVVIEAGVATVALASGGPGAGGDVVAGAEGATLAGEHDQMHGGAVVGLPQGLVELLYQLTRQRVQLFGAVERDVRDGVALFVADVLEFHRRLLATPPRCAGDLTAFTPPRESRTSGANVAARWTPWRGAQRWKRCVHWRC